MDYTEVESSREFLARLEHGGDWRAQIETFAAEEDVSSAVFHGLGSVEAAELFYYNQDTEEYEAVSFPEPLEVAACVGNVSTLDGEPFAHTHAVLSRADESTVAGHLNAATVFAGELYVRTFETDLVRAHDEATGLDLWPL